MRVQSLIDFADNYYYYAGNKVSSQILSLLRIGGGLCIDRLWVWYFRFISGLPASLSKLNGVHEHGRSAPKDNRLPKPLLRRRFITRRSFPEATPFFLLQLAVSPLPRRLPQRLSRRQQADQAVRQLLPLCRYHSPSLSLSSALSHRKLGRCLSRLWKIR